MYPYLVSDGQLYTPSNDVNLSCLLRVAEGRTAEIHTSTLIVTDISSNVVRFRVTDEPLTDVHALTMEPVNKRSGIPYEPHLMVRFHNRTKEPVNLFEAFQASNLFVDAMPVKRTMFNWNGSVALMPNAAWGTFLSLDEYEPKISPGVHQVQFEFAGERSNVLTVNW